MFSKNRVYITIFSIILALLFLSVGTSVKAQDSQQKRLSCTNQTLQGLYGVRASGSIQFGAIAFDIVFQNNFDGNGNVRGLAGYTSIGGNIATQLSDTGTYQVNENCTVTIEFKNNNDTNPPIPSVIVTNVEETIHLAGAIVNNGRKIFYIQTDPGVNLSGVWEKV